MAETPTARFIGSEIYRHSRYGEKHPLGIPRVSTCIDLCRALGWLPDAVYLDCPQATPAQLARFHDPAYVAAVQRAERLQAADEEMQRRHNLGVNGNPVFGEVFRRPATSAGGSLLGARLAAAGTPVYNPAGGTHHGRPDRASGFCFFNDPALALLALLDLGLERLVYLDIDAHHGDGVQDAFHADDRVLTLSIHEHGRWPMRADNPAGTAADRAGGAARNFPVPPGLNDSEMAFLIEESVLPLIAAHRPQAIVLQGGVDALADDPLAKLSLSNGAIWRAVAQVRALTPHLLVLGGGGYNPWSVGRAWAGIWATLSGREIPDRLPPDAEAVLRRIVWRHRYARTPPERWFTHLPDPPADGPIRAEIRALAAEHRH